MGGSPSKDAETCPRHASRGGVGGCAMCQAHCAPSSSACAPGAVNTSPRLKGCRPDLASLAQRGKLSLGTAGAARQEMRNLELKAGHKPARGQRGAAHAYNLRSHREQERRWIEQAELAYSRSVAGWNPRGPGARTGAAKEERQ